MIAFHATDCDVITAKTSICYNVIAVINQTLDSCCFSVDAVKLPHIIMALPEEISFYSQQLLSW